MQGRDLIGLAQTGTGKTAAFALPLMERLLNGSRGRIRALIVSPTRELAEQIVEAIDALGQRTGLKSLAIYGGVSMEHQFQRLRSGVEIAVACPGRLLDHVWKGTIDLSQVEVLIIDEADRMFDMGFLPDVRNILRCLEKPRQTLLFSATMPDDIRRLAKDILKDPVTVQIGRTAPAKTVSHALYPVNQQRKTSLLIELLRNIEAESVLVFTRTKHRAERVAQQLKQAGYRAASLQGNLTQPRRQAALNGFRTGQYKVLVATDVAARGIDILSISHVVNYDMPETIDAYTHRIGRTGRVEKNGDALTFVTSADAEMIYSLERVLQATLERRTLKGFEYALPTADNGGRRPLRQPGRRPARRKRIGNN
jgi:ATP-dependent RNA helicase RhlE